ncbi:hypothetical protein SARC_06580 [Sphaeroforma arctica JP610]|uniref:OTU domain-containing protein n=1 Tax=Sphaeroforma arctica JP610 TaxID=667725 RepID=A0A0L0FW88_9EUKA|nr:hypothetical protein SARC_06580 [Sphaeroforma arctica JP610]KNC81077.1 hypothetical protein SARC_06580 [Sphaeroforma arctica JP610]|eukprot:XP_014154979.1 hypothetical protein SARC_06580 [Sphaeroforma arctica JP610]
MVGVIDLPVDMSDLQEYKEDWYDILKDKDGSSKGEGKILIGVRVTDGRRKVTKDGGLPTEYMSMADDAQIIKRLTQQVDPVSLFLAMPRVMIVMKRKAQKAREAVELRNSSDYIPKKVKNESSERKQLNDRLELLGLTLKESEGDGNCQFRSFSFQLYGTQEHYKEIRKLICQWMRDHSESFSFYFNGDAEWQSYLKTMSRDREWGDELTLKAASDVLGANVHVVSSTLTNWYLTYTPDAQPQEQRKQIFLAYLSPVHYNSIILNKDAAAYSTPNTSKENLKDA